MYVCMLVFFSIAKKHNFFISNIRNKLKKEKVSNNLQEEATNSLRTKTTIAIIIIIIIGIRIKEEKGPGSG